MFRGFATLNFYADDVPAARDWYAELFGVEAYYAYPPAPAEPGSPGGAVMHWHVADLQGTVDRLLASGATEHRPITEHGDGSGFVTASVVDPFGNVLGVMHNPHYLEVLARREQAMAPSS